MNKKLVTCTVCAVCILAAGCQQNESAANKTAKENEKAKGYVETLVDTNKKAQDNIAKAIDEENKKLDEAISVLEDDPQQTNNNSQTTMKNIPSEIDMALAKTCKEATITTNKGDITISFLNSDAPVTVANFCTLAKKGFYKDVIFHRVIKDFMIQGGDPTGTGTGGPGYKFDDEITTNNRNDVGTIAMANAGPGTNGSQFFINTKANNFLDTKHTVFGKITSGMDVVTTIEDVEKNAQDKPLEDVVIKSINVTVQ